MMSSGDHQWRWLSCCDPVLSSTVYCTTILVNNLSVQWNKCRPIKKRWPPMKMAQLVWPCAGVRCHQIRWDRNKWPTHPPTNIIFLSRTETKIEAIKIPSLRYLDALSPVSVSAWLICGSKLHAASVTFAFGAWSWYELTKLSLMLTFELAAMLPPTFLDVSPIHQMRCWVPPVCYHPTWEVNPPDWTHFSLLTLEVAFSGCTNLWE